MSDEALPQAGNSVVIDAALAAILAERIRQDKKWGEQNHDPIYYGGILIEEVGEFFQAALETRFGGKHGGREQLMKEAIHVAAVGLAIVQCLLRDKWDWATLNTKEPGGVNGHNPD